MERSAFGWDEEAAVMNFPLSGYHLAARCLLALNFITRLSRFMSIVCYRKQSLDLGNRTSNAIEAREILIDFRFELRKLPRLR